VSYARTAGGRTSVRFTEQHLADIAAAREHRIEPPTAGRAAGGQAKRLRPPAQYNIARLARRNRR
jgi:hypothetical protein